MNDDSLLVRQADLQRDAATFVQELGHPLLHRCSSLHYANDREERRHYFVVGIEGWKVDVSLWFAGVPPAVEAFQAELPARLTHESRLAILRLKDAGTACRTIRKS